MTDLEVRNAPMYALHNATAIGESENAGCYQCLAVVSTNEIVDWTDWGKTALCPKCGCDCLLAQTFAIPLDEESLKKIHDYYFKV